jgi:large subunit ribosomal protein L21
MRPAQPGETIQFDRVLLISAEGGATVGTPVIPEAKVIAEVVGEVKGEKIHTMRFKRRKRVHVRTGHRQHYIRVRVKQIVVPGAAEAPKAE